MLILGINLYVGIYNTDPYERLFKLFLYIALINLYKFALA